MICNNILCKYNTIIYNYYAWYSGNYWLNVHDKAWQYPCICIVQSGCIMFLLSSRDVVLMDKRYSWTGFSCTNLIIIITCETPKNWGRNIHSQTLKIFLQHDNAQVCTAEWYMYTSSCHKWFKWVQNSLTVLSRVTVQEYHGNPAVGERSLIT